MPSTVHVVGWPRWMRDHVAVHPMCDDLGVQRTVLADSIPPNATTVRLTDRASETEFRRTLTALTAGADCLALSEGIDRDGTVHDTEVVMFLRLGDAPPEEAPGDGVQRLAYHFRRWRHATPTPPPSSPALPSPEGSEPSWLADAAPSPPPDVSVPEEGFDPSWLADATPSPPPDVSVPEERSEPSWLTKSPPSESNEGDGSTSSTVPVEDRPSDTATFTTALHHDAECVLVLEGVYTPNALASLAQPNVATYLPTEGVAKQVTLTRVRNAIWIGAYVVDVTSWSPSARAYRVVPRESRSQIAPRRTVVEMHRLKRREFERR